MSVDDALSVDVELDGADNRARAVVVERRQVEVDELFQDGELRLWEDSEGWTGYVREERDDGVAYYRVNGRHDTDSWIDHMRVGEGAVRDAVRQHIRDPLAGDAGVFRRGVYPTMTSEIPDEVEERLVDLEGQVRALHNAREYLLEQVEELQEENEELREELEAVETTAETAYSIAGETSEPARADAGPSKTRRAAILSRNEVVQQAITSRGKGGSVTAGEVKQMAKPEMSNLYLV